jgi:hypothetical protein
MNSTLGDMLSHPKAGPVVRQMMAAAMGPGARGRHDHGKPGDEQAMLNDMPLRTVVGFFRPGP